LLLEAAREQQVLFFTCHPQTVAMLKALEPGVNVVEMKRYAGAESPPAPVIVAQTPLPRAEPSLEPALGARILECLEQAEAPLGRAQLLEAAGIPESAWQSTIRELKDRGLVLQFGDKRGATYALNQARPKDTE
ncbi:MAG: hypothetical protein ACLGIN_15155, partial [Candidatus Sericytochromatia bacterium]